jgi:hypothetical protein
MEDLPEHENHFFINVSTGQVYCRLCGKRCKRLTLPMFAQFWCATRACANFGEVKRYFNGKWEVYSFLESREGCCSKIIPKLLMTISSGTSPGG